MKKKADFWDGIIEESEPSAVKKAFIGIASWSAVLCFGVLLLLGLLWLVAMMVDVGTSTGSGKVGVIYGLIAVPILLAIILSIKQSSPLFYRYARPPLIMGLGLNSIVLVISIIGLTSFYNQQTEDLSASSCTSLGKQLENAQQAVVPIATNLGAGTAFAVSVDNITLLTAYHVIEGASEVYANYVSGRVDIIVKDVAPEYDLAVLEIAAPTSGHLKLSDSYQLANSVYAYGFPSNTYSGGQASLSTGVISRVLSNDDLKLNYADTPDGLEMIQTDAAVNPGNSGGPLFNHCGAIGVISAMSDSNQWGEYGFASEQGISYAISTQTILQRFQL